MVRKEPVLDMEEHGCLFARLTARKKWGRLSLRIALVSEIMQMVSSGLPWYCPLNPCGPRRSHKTYFLASDTRRFETSSALNGRGCVVCPKQL
jgi:hypothetical protein